MIPLPESVARLSRYNTHPGLALDKFVNSYASPEGAKFSEYVQTPTVQNVARLGSNTPAGIDFADLLDRRRLALKGLPHAAVFWATTRTPLAASLARACALENAGICLHPIYGFVHLPGSGLKGVAQAYAVEHWLLAQSNHQAAWEEILHVFGWAPSPWGRDVAQRLKVFAPPGAQSGSVVFHDSWPSDWPRLAADIVNNHHQDYYSENLSPGDWENPNPIHFLTAKAGQQFEFCLSARRNGSGMADIVEKARMWLEAGLTLLGAGAKTAAGYGLFDVPNFHGDAASSIDLQLLSPAFLGGADRNAAREVRVSNVKGLLRYWYRVWHPGTAIEALAGESTTFGSLKTGNGLHLAPGPKVSLKLLAKGANMGGGGSPLGYLGYGPITYETAAKLNRTQVDALDANQTFALTIRHNDDARRSDVLKSLWLLSALGGIGSRSRRGWGSLQLTSTVAGLPNLSLCASIEDYRTSLISGLDTLVPIPARLAPNQLSWTAISKNTRIIFSTTTFDSWKTALEDLGRRYQSFRSRDRRGNLGEVGPDYIGTKRILSPKPGEVTPTTAPERAAFGLPFAQTYTSLGGVRADFDPRWTDALGETIIGRRASPLFFKVGKLQTPQNPFFWQVTYLPAQFLPQGAEIAASTKTGGSKGVKSLGNFASPGPLGLARPGQSLDRTLVAEFLEWLTSGTPAVLPEEIKPRVSTLPPPPTLRPKPLNKGRTVFGTLTKNANGDWVAALFDAVTEADVQVQISNRRDIPPGAENAKAEFYIEEYSKKQKWVRFDKLKPA